MEGVEDYGLKKDLPAVGKGVAAAPELGCVELGDWYQTLGETAPTPAKRAMFEPAKAYYERFLALHEAEGQRMPRRPRWALAICLRVGVDARILDVLVKGEEGFSAPAQPANHHPILS